MGKWILNDHLREYLNSKDLIGISNEKQSSYNKKVRDRIEPALEDLILAIKMEKRYEYTPKISRELFDKKLVKLMKELIIVFLEPKTSGYNNYLKDFKAFQRIKELLDVLNGSLNKILLPQKIQDMKLMPNSNISKNRYPNIAALEMMFWAYSDLEKGE